MTQRAKEASDLGKDLVFVETMAIGLKEMEERYGQKRQALQDEHIAQAEATKQLKDKAEEVRNLCNVRSRELRDQEEKMVAATERVRTRDVRLMEHKTQLNAQAKGLVARE